MPSFVNTAEELTYYKRLEAETRRPAGQGVVHPDRCPKLPIRGVAWAVPPRGERIMPVFGDDGQVVEVTTSSAGEWAEIDALIQAVELPDGALCRTCGQATGTSIAATSDFLRAAFSLAGRALRSQYALSHEQLTDLLAFDIALTPGWFEPLIRWALSLPQAGPAPVAPQRPKRWWQVWRRARS